MGQRFADPQDSRRERSTHIHPHHPTDEDVLPRNCTASIEPRHGVLNNVEESGNRPAEPDDSGQPKPPDAFEAPSPLHSATGPHSLPQSFDQTACRSDQLHSPEAQTSSSSSRDSPSKTPVGLFCTGITIRIKLKPRTN